MSWLSDLRARLASLLFRATEERELAEELRFHLEQEEAAGVARGLGPEEARRQARLKLGGVERTKEDFRDARGVRPAEDLARDVRLAFRSFARTPAFTVTAVLVLALGIGATTSIFSAVRAVVLRPLPFAEPDRLYMLWASNPQRGWDREAASPADYLDWKERVSSFADVEAYSSTSWQPTISGLDRPLVLDARNVTGGLFSMLGVRPMLGRDFREEETWAEWTWRAGETPLLISAATWRTVFGSDEEVVGRSVLLNRTPARVIGVMPEGFAFPSPEVDLWIPAGWASEARDSDWFREARWVRPIARLAPGVTAEEASVELAAVAARLEGEHPQVNRLTSAGMSPLHAFLVGDTRTPLLIVLGAVGVLLVIACANVGNLLLVRASARHRNLAVRAALGAGRGRLVRQALTESLVLAVLGGATGTVLGVAGTRLLERLQPEGFLRVASFPVDVGVVGFAVATTLAAALFFGAFPALLVRRTGPGEALREAGRTGAGTRGTRRVADGLVVAEVALAVLLVLGAGLLVRSMAELRQVDPGFEPERVVALGLSLPGRHYPGPQPVLAFYDGLLARIQALPGVEAVAASSTLPLRERGPSTDFFIAGRAPDEYGTEMVWRIVTTGYFEAMGVPLLAGRTFTDADAGPLTDEGWGAWDAGAGERVAIINEAMARQYFPGEDPVGQRITTDRTPDSTSVWRTIVGVVGSERQRAIGTPPQIELIEPHAQHPESRMFVYVRTATDDPAAVVPAVRAAVRELDPELPIIDAVAMEEVVDDSMARERFLMLLLLAFAAVALVLALVGVYGVTAQAAHQRLPELGLRVALGARAADVVRLTLGRSATLVGAGLGLGLAGSLLATRAMAGMLYGITPNDPATFAVVTLLLTGAGLAASWIPARRAASVDPARTLRAE